MPLIIVESPTKSKTISKFLDKEYQVLSSYGHVRDLPKSELGIDIEDNFKIKYILMPKARKNINILKKAAEKADQIILATDHDREGEAIAYHLAHILNLNHAQDYQRIVFQEITKEAIQNALNHPRKINLDLVNAQQARRVLDRIVGYKLSPFLWKKIARGLSAGRVQSIAVKLICSREEEINKFKPTEYWSIEALLKKEDDPIEIKALLIKKDQKPVEKLSIKNEKAAQTIREDLHKATYQITNLEKKEIKRNPPPPFITSTLQQAAWHTLYFPAKQTMRVAQQLYEKGLITYHRTDSLNLSQQSLTLAQTFIQANYGKAYWARKTYKTKSKTAQEAHEAIRPTYPEKEPTSLKLEKNQAKLYELIWRRFIASQMQPATFYATTVDIQANNYTFRATGQTLKFPGFLKVYLTQNIKALSYQEKALPELKPKEILKLISLTPNQHFTEPPPRYNEASLIKILEQNGIGRPSTYAPIISHIQDKHYIEKNEQKRFIPTEIGQAVNDMLVKHFPDIVDINFTANMEKELDEIAAGTQDWLKVIKDFYNPFAKHLATKYKAVSKKDLTEKPTDKLCPKCQSPLLIRLGRYGKFYACSAFPKCKYVASLEENKLNVPCPKCKKGELIEKRTKKHKIFYACNRYPKCDFALWDKPLKESCPKCKYPLTQTKKGLVKCTNKECTYQKE